MHVQVVNVHDSLVFTLLGEVLAYPEAALSRYIVRVLRHLSLTPSNYTNLRQVQALLERVVKVGLRVVKVGLRVVEVGHSVVKVGLSVVKVGLILRTRCVL